MTTSDRKTAWKGPTIHQVAEVSGVGPATVDRVLNNRPGVREQTRQRVRTAFEKLRQETSVTKPLRIALHCESGDGFNGEVRSAIAALHRSEPGVVVSSAFTVTYELDANAFAARLLEDGTRTDGSVVVAREHPAINGAIRQLRRKGKPVVCLTSDLPSSRRNTYVGNDQHAAGSVAAQVIGRSLPKTPLPVLLMMSVAFRSQKDREMGFRRVLRTSFPHLRIEEPLISDDSPDTTHRHLADYFAAHGVPPAIYNVAGANRGVAQALVETGCADDAILVGHELTPVSRGLLQAGTMDFIVAHDLKAELTQAVRWIGAFLEGVTSEPDATQILLHTRYNCGL
ncbi:trehalose repressor [Antarctobacter heliothermus]|uniref:Trehalose repressor n=1 Tax=Antarctobacter heliothermus TaxID=74033 RepID=A0A222E7K9_9RHOB|nr:LacI family DNA-binding transcriptional regulator [Antarctobacter heliothermus]ASP22090.1 trehalose repressor [Antarctobacter heliothermus]